MTLAILGRQPKIGLAELESLFGELRPIGDSAALIHTTAVDINRLGGTLKIATPLRELATANWPEIMHQLTTALPDLIHSLPEGKLKLGLSAYGFRVTTRQLLGAGLDLKKIARQQGRSVRVVPNTATVLNSAQLLHNQLTSDLGMEILLVRDGTRTWLARTMAVQDVDAYAQRDHGRPKRDAFVGMLPPKLAQQMLNLAQVQPGQTVLDPFCGTGVVLQESLLAGALTYGTDLSEKMIDYTKQNLAWVAKTYGVAHPTPLEVADATTHRWGHSFDHVVCETYLGQPLSGLPRPEKLGEIIATCDAITRAFLKNLRSQVPAGSRHCVAVPAWRVGPTFRHLPTLDHLEKIGYNRVRFQHATSSELVYHREDQIVARELLILTAR